MAKLISVEYNLGTRVNLVDLVSVTVKYSENMLTRIVGKQGVNSIFWVNSIYIKLTKSIEFTLF